MMPLFAKVVGGEIVAREQKESPASATSSDGGPVWRPIVEDKPAFDARNQQLTGPIDVIEQDRVVRQWTVEAIPHADMENRVALERERRLQAGFDYDFGDARGVHRIGTTNADMVGWREVTDLANALIATNNGSTTINVLTDTGAVGVTATEWADVLIAAAQFRQPFWAASFAIQALDPIPADYADDARWP